MKRKFQSKAAIRRADELLRQGALAIDGIRDHFNMEWGDNAHTDLDVALSHVLRKIDEARNGLDDVLLKYRGKSITPNFPRKQSAKPAVTVSDLQKALVC